MKVSIYKEDEPKGVEMRLSLREDNEDGTVTIMGRAAGDDEPWIILTIGTDGFINREPHISRNTGWPLTPDGRLKIQ